MAQILPIRPAATILTLRDGSDGAEVLMLRRNLRSDFVGGAYVFPGGGVDDDDGRLEGLGLTVGLDDVMASNRLNLESGGLVFYVAALRELFEEAGLLITCDARGEATMFDVERRERLVHQRAQLNAGTIDFASILRDEGLQLDLRGVDYLAHWVTPVGPPRRFDTRFFVVKAPPNQVAAHDAGETVADRWLRPTDALDAHRLGEFEMIFPTVRNLEAIRHLHTVDDILNYARVQVTVPRVEPRIVQRDGQGVILIEGDEGFAQAGDS